MDNRVKIFVDKVISYIDEDVLIKIIGLEADKLYRVNLSSDEYYAVNTKIKKVPVGTLWTSEVVFKSDKNGEINLSKQIPKSKEYDYSESLGLFTHMSYCKPKKINIVNKVEDLPRYNECKFSLKVYDGGNLIAEKSIIRQFCDETVISEDLTFGKMKARFFEKKDRKIKKAVIVLSGSDGRLEKAQAIAQCFASKGYAAIAVGYFGMAGMSENLVKIPIDNLEKVIEWLDNKSTVDSENIQIYGRSKGGEMALLAASMFPKIHKTIVVMPSCFVYSGLKENVPAFKQSSWSYKGESIDFLKYGMLDSMKMIFRSKILKDKFALKKLAHDTYVKNKNAEKAMIPLEKINGDILIITSEDDTVWPSKEYGEIAVKYLKEHKFKHEVKMCNYPGAGHMIILPNQSFGDLSEFGGGEKEKCIEANRKAWSEIMKFIQGDVKNEEKSFDTKDVDVINNCLKSVQGINKIDFVKPKNNEGIHVLSYPNYPKELSDFWSMMEKNKLFNYNYIQDIEEVEKDNIDDMTIHDVYTYLTFICRGEKFCDGHMVKFIEDGTIGKLLNKIKELNNI
ncbi:MAG: acyl-CoA thioester hydrolase/BAAT C-terminal domain-containing protein [Clostridiaceae bacterium]|nr:acyl-CoA thioester hydrolase/BAAT C-terminal domain-containing protein [Clostridiaceae bacterium]